MPPLEQFREKCAAVFPWQLRRNKELDRIRTLNRSSAQIEANGMASVSDFEQGQTFTIEAGGKQIPLELSAVKPIAASPRPGGGFSLLFRGPRDIALPQATYLFTGESGSHEIFIVPVAADAAGRLYEAVFN
ncbi:hypothetical protein LB519_05770 [Mesorhizobium sp. AD1-1]|uniref:DUF6916 family protein n=1 Tax=Mesorhizobium sp. AD1-1 TaxID=2876621 RepID=UPI001CCA5C99|nr:hypothetical protein [Mesorhizobium sp. AD1-1]MBZ9717349.1 hypothetical protein [Mesorhizobium sp. AD1-1]